MKCSETALVVGLLACCAVLPLLLAGGLGAVTGLLAGNSLLAGVGLALVVLALVVWLRRRRGI
jgi:hypothetical protein